MPPLPVVPNVVKFALQCEGNDGRKAVNVFHWVYGGSVPILSALNEFATNLFNLWDTNFAPLMPAQTSIVSVTCIDLSTTSGYDGFYDNLGVPVPGTSVHGMLPLHTAALLNKQIAVRYRGGRPRSYLCCGTTDDLNDDGDWKTGSVSNFINAWLNVVDGMVGNASGGCTLGEECSVSYYSKEETPTPPYRRVTPVVYDIPVDAYQISSQLATQRRRVRRTARRR